MTCQFENDREIESILNLHPHSQNILTLESQGLLLIEIYHLRRLASSFLPTKKRELFEKDMTELEKIFDPNWTSGQGLETCRRMRRTYACLVEPQPTV
jgi:hypothetical protein